MNTSTYQGETQVTAKIYQFPLGGRHAVVVPRRGTIEEMAAAMPQHICDALDNCWYHDDAVRHAGTSNA